MWSLPAVTIAVFTENEKWKDKGYEEKPLFVIFCYFLGKILPDWGEIEVIFQIRGDWRGGGLHEYRSLKDEEDEILTCVLADTHRDPGHSGSERSPRSPPNTGSQRTAGYSSPPPSLSAPGSTSSTRSKLRKPFFWEAQSPVGHIEHVAVQHPDQTVSPASQHYQALWIINSQFYAVFMPC